MTGSHKQLPHLQDYISNHTNYQSYKPMKTVKTHLFLLLAILSAATAQAGDLDARPVQKPITVRTEIERGQSAVNALPVSPVTMDPLKYSALLYELENANKQKNADTDAFLVGFHYAAWRCIWRTASLTGSFGHERSAGLWGHVHHAFFKKYCEKLELTPDQVKELFRDYAPEAQDAAWEAAVKANRFSGTAPKL
jgi:hypothetical protein